MRFNRFLFFIIFLIFLQLSFSLFAGVSVIGGLTRETTLSLGGKKEGKIIIKNGSEKAQEVKIYQTDYLFWADGRNSYGEPGTTGRSNAKWITFTPKQITLPPNGSEAVYYTIEIPKEENLCGTYWSIFMVEPISSEVLEPPKQEKDKVVVGIKTVVRYAIQIITNIGDTGKKDIKFVDKKLIVEEGKKFLQLDVENTGERCLVPLVWAELYDEKGINLGRFDGGRFRIYPSCSVRYKIDLSEVPSGKYKALIVADSGDENVFGAQYDLEL